MLKVLLPKWGGSRIYRQLKEGVDWFRKSDVWPTKEVREPNSTSEYLSISHNSYTQLAIPLDRLIEGFLLSGKVENKSPVTVSFYKNILDKFRWFLQKFGIEAIDATTITECTFWLLMI